jgi:hypothetical protein
LSGALTRWVSMFSAVINHNVTISPNHIEQQRKNSSTPCSAIMQMLSSSFVTLLRHSLSQAVFS